MILAGFPPFQPSPGLAIWTLLIFLIFWTIIGKYGFKPIVNGLKKRENDIDEALQAADKAKREVAQMSADNEKLLEEAREERLRIINEAQASGNKIVAESKDKAKTEASTILENANQEIANQKAAAMAEVKNDVGLMALGLAENIIKEQLGDKYAQEELNKKLIQDINL